MKAYHGYNPTRTDMDRWRTELAAEKEAMTTQHVPEFQRNRVTGMIERVPVPGK